MSIELKQEIAHPNQARDNTIIAQMTPKEIIKKYDGGSTSFTSNFRRELWKAHHKKCAYCGVGLECHSDMRIDHFIPRSKVLDDSVDNLVSSCHRCNSVKGKYDLEYFRFSLAVANSVLYGVIQPNVAKKLIALGVDLPIILQPFYFEQIGAKA